MFAKLILSVEFYWITVAAGVWYTSSWDEWVWRKMIFAQRKKDIDITHTHTHVRTPHSDHDDFFGVSFFSLKINEMKKYAIGKISACSLLCSNAKERNATNFPPLAYLYIIHTVTNTRTNGKKTCCVTVAKKSWRKKKRSK